MSKRVKWSIAGAVGLVVVLIGGLGAAKRNNKAVVERMSAMKKSNTQLVSDEQMEQLKTSVDVNVAMAESSQHLVEQARAALKEARTMLGKTTIFAPMAGRVTRLNVENGETAIQGTF